MKGSCDGVNQSYWSIGASLDNDFVIPKGSFFNTQLGILVKEGNILIADFSQSRPKSETLFRIPSGIKVKAPPHNEVIIFGFAA
jgi:hypothetical protein